MYQQITCWMWAWLCQLFSTPNRRIYIQIWMSSVNRTDTIVWMACADDILCDLIGWVSFVFMDLVGIKFWRWYIVPCYFDNWVCNSLLFCHHSSIRHTWGGQAFNRMKYTVQTVYFLQMITFVLTLILARLSYLTVAMFFSMCASSRTTYCIRRILNIFRSSGELLTMLYLYPKEGLLLFPV